MELGLDEVCPWDSELRYKTNDEIYQIIPEAQSSQERTESHRSLISPPIL